MNIARQRLHNQHLARATFEEPAAILSPTIVIDGQVVGTWTRTLKKKDTVVMTPRPFAKLGDAGTRAVAAAAERYRRFLS